MRVYLSGPMKGYPDSNFPAFHETARELRSQGLDVVNPAEINVKGAENDADFYNQCLRADLKAMMDCEAIALMRGWEKSNGANLELHVAHRVGMRVLFVEDLLSAKGGQDGAQAVPAISDAAIQRAGELASQKMASDLTRFDAACEVLKWMREQGGAPYHVMHRMHIVLHGQDGAQG